MPRASTIRSDRSPQGLRPEIARIIEELARYTVWREDRAAQEAAAAAAAREWEPAAPCK